MEIFIIVSGLSLLFLLWWFANSVKTVRGDQRALHLRFGEVKKVKMPGLRFCWKWIDQWVIYSTKEHCLPYEPLRMFTKKGSWGGPALVEYEKYLAETEEIKKEIKEIEELEKSKKDLSSEERKALAEQKAELKEKYQAKSQEEEQKRREYKKEAEEYDSAEIPVGATLYFWWPTEEEDLKQAFQFGPSPGDPEDPKYIEKLKKEFEDVIMGSLREIIGDMTWGEVVSRREQIAKRLRERLMEPESPFDRAKIKQFYVVISEVDLPENLKKLLTRRQEEKLKAEAAKQTAQRLNLEIGEGIGRAAKTLQKMYKFPQEKAQDAAIERHGDILAAREGEFKRIQWMTKGSGGGDGGSIGGIKPEVIAQAVVVAQEMLKTKKENPAATTPTAETEKEEKKEKKIEEMTMEEQEKLIEKWAAEEEEEAKKPKKKK